MTSYSSPCNICGCEDCYIFNVDGEYSYFDPKKNEKVHQSCHTGVTLTEADGIDMEFCWTALPPYTWEPCRCKWPDGSDVSWENHPPQFHDHRNATQAKHVDPEPRSSGPSRGSTFVVAIIVLAVAVKLFMYFGYRSHKRREEISRRAAGEIQEFRDHSEGMDDLQMTGEFGNPSYEQSSESSPHKIV